MSKYLGDPSDPGEWWCDLDSSATDMGPGVSFSIRVASDDMRPPFLLGCYGLQSDVVMERVQAEADRMIGEYRSRPSKRTYGDLPPVRREQFQDLRQILNRYAAAAVSPPWGIHPRTIRGTLLDVVGSCAVVDRIIEIVSVGALESLLRGEDLP